MSKLTTRDVESRLRRAVTAADRSRAEALWDRSVERAKGDEWYLDGAVAGKPERRTARYAAAFAAVAALLALVLLPSFLLHPKVEATVYLDVNPAIELAVDRRERVISVRADNADGDKILAGMDLRKTDLDVALNAILGAMVRNGYLSDAKSVLLLSVDSADAARASRLQQSLSAQADQCLRSLTGSGLVLSQSVRPGSGETDLASRHGITPGKAALLLKLAEDHPELDPEDLAELSMTELVRLVRRQSVDLGAYLDWDDDDGFDWDDGFDDIDEPGEDDEVDDEAGDGVDDEIDDGVDDEIDDEVDDEVDDEIDDEVDDGIDDGVDDEPELPEPAGSRDGGDEPENVPPREEPEDNDEDEEPDDADEADEADDADEVDDADDADETGEVDDADEDEETDELDEDDRDEDND